MTTQEFVNKLSRTEGKLLFGLAEESESMLIAKEEFKNGYYNGLNKGLEIAKDFAKYCQAYYIQVSDGVWQSCIDETDNKHYTSSELLSIYLTEKYGK